MKQRSVSMSTLGCVLALGACTGDVQVAQENGDTTSPVIAETGGRWSNRKNIPVCFTAGDGTSDMERGTRKLIESEYAKVGLCFSGWDRCSASTPCPAVRIEYGPPNAENVNTAGWSYVGAPSWFCNAGDYQKPTLWLRTDQWDWAAVHEFGHAIGLQHEHARTDNDGSCAYSKDEQIADDGDTDYITPYDDDSVMCYCSGHSRLSSLDIQGIKQFYSVGNDLSCSGNPDPGGYRLAWNSAGPIAGMTCTQINEPADPDTWNDNYLCSDQDLGLRWSYAGPISGMVCTHIHEGSDPHGWNDNYLCAPRDLGLRYSSAGPIAGMTCTQLSEGSDPDTWQDNYLCKP
jgi:hypothetical protein